ncbi:MAG: hypothetical protein WAL66_00015, partial [Nitrososphaeraceae archaeon]
MDMKNERTNFILAVLVVIIIVTAAVVMASFNNNNFSSRHMAYAHHIIAQIPTPSRPMGLSLSSDSSQLLYVSNFGLPIVSTINT